MPVIPPTVGRVVLFHPSPSDPELGGYVDRAASQPMAALVTAVWSDTCVNLAVFDPNGGHHGRTSVFLHQGEGPCPTHCFAEWMPYQKGQAAKTEQAEANAAIARGE